MEDKKWALVTGAARGIGRAICLELAREGYQIYFSYGSNEEAALETQKLCGELGVEAVAVRSDVRSSDACKELVKGMVAVSGRIDLLVNNAGITKDGLLMRMKDRDLEEVLDVNLKGAFYMMREVSGLMIRQRSGSIINITSVVGIIGNGGQVNYAASKAGVIGMTKSLARELAGRGIRVNAVAPGMIETDMTDKLSDAQKAAMVSKILLGRPGRPEEIASAVAFLAGERASYITGQVLCVDGGMVV